VLFDKARTVYQIYAVEVAHAEGCAVGAASKTHSGEAYGELSICRTAACSDR